VIHLRPVAAGPERQQTTQRHVGLGLTVVADRIPVPEPLELLTIRCVSRFLEEVFVFEVDVNVGCTGCR
jgi:hypothetical protein